MRLLALQPYDTTSHRAFLTGWCRNSRHGFEVLSLPGRHFKWRVRQAPIAFAEQVEARAAEGGRWDALWCTSMLDLATLRGLSPSAASLPSAVYFHENQLAYPTRHTDPRDAHFGLTNMTTALAAIASQLKQHVSAPPACVWWNSRHNRDSFLDALGSLLKQMPDHPPAGVIEAIRAASAIHYPGIDLVPPRPRDAGEPPIVLWAARWEHDKRPELFCQAVDLLADRGVRFRLSVIGQRFQDQPDCLNALQARHGDRLVRWGFQETREAYQAALQEASIVVSTAHHEFFGLAVAEAVSAGCVAVLPDALAYPEVWGDTALYHDQTPAGIADTVERAITSPQRADGRTRAAAYARDAVAPRLDDAIERLAHVD